MIRTSPGGTGPEADEAVCERIRSSLIGSGAAITTPFGVRRVVYADYTASGRSVGFIEDYIRQAVLPYYANTHTETSGTGLRTTSFREQARDIIRRSVGASASEHAVIFAGSGSTGAIDRLISILGLRSPRQPDEGRTESATGTTGSRPVVLVGPFEHHSNEVQWRETVAEVIEVDQDDEGHIDLGDLERHLREVSGRGLVIGSFSAASNVTGIMSDVAGVSALLHRYGALAFWDFAAAAPYTAISVGSATSEDGDHLDAVFISPHKLVGGPGTPGVLVVRRDLLKNAVPSVPGGGTVSYVSTERHHYLENPEHREEGGTPDIIGSIRAGLAFALKETVGVDVIRNREHHFVREAIRSWADNPQIRVLGDTEVDRLAIVSFLVRAPSALGPDRYLHHNFVVALLNDLFGIQARGGCSCAGPYGHRLLGIDLPTSRRYETEILKGCELVKPGWARINFNYFIEESEADFLIEAVHLIATDGWKLLPQYRFDVTAGTWRHEAGVTETQPRLEDFTAWNGDVKSGQAPSLQQCIAEARALLDAAPVAPGHLDSFPATAESLRWFAVPSDFVETGAATRGV
ncbi:MAG: aminotransferase class V-fold PLP-dependent enzyme [Acidimicrobiia bacterium]